MKSVLISIQPKWCELIVRGEKTIEMRKTAPKIETPFKCYIYETRGFERVGNANLNCVIGGKGRGVVIGEFICDEIYDMRDVLIEPTCLTIEEWCKYTDNHKGIVYGWHISDLKVYDKPKELNEFYRWYDGVTDIRPCQNGKSCYYTFYDYSENCQACRIDYDGTDCPFLRVQRPPQSWMYIDDE